jgi:hypothetical protein
MGEQRAARLGKGTNGIALRENTQKLCLYAQAIGVAHCHKQRILG